jgi:uncharacterized repeat protein (TIGR01451 family)
MRRSLRVFIAAISSLLFLLGNPTNLAAVEFAAAKSYPVGTNPAAIVVGDFNGDGKPDIAVANSVSNNVSILFGNGDGTFQSAVNFAAGNSPSGIAVGDFNGDGKLDLALFQPGNPGNSLPEAGSISILLGNGDGTFQAPKTTALTAFATAMVVADFDLDKKSDLAVSNVDNSTGTLVVSLSIFLGNGDGTFQSAKQTSIPSTSGRAALSAADFDGDGKPDIAVGTSSGILILLGKGDGTFSQGATIPVTLVVESILTADFNLDGKVDLLVNSSGGGCGGFFRCHFFSNIGVFLGNGDGTFQGEQIVASGGTFAGGGVLSPFVGDFNGDGKLDVAYVRNNSLEIQLGKGDGTFSFVISTGIAATSSNMPGPAPAVTGDFNGDKLSDLAVIDDATNSVSVVLNASPTSGADVAIASLTANPQPALVGSNLTYSIEVVNSGPQDATNVSMTDTLPPGVTFASATATQGTCAGTSAVTCALGSLPSPSFVSVTVVVTPNQAGSIVDTASVTATEPDLVPNNNTASVTSTVVLPADLAVTNTASASSITLGSNISYTLKVTNNGPASATNVMLADDVTSSVNVVSFTQSQGSCPAGPSSGCNLGTLAPGATATATFVVTPNAAGPLTSIASVGADQPDQNTSNNVANVTVNVTDFTLTPASGTVTAQTGQQVTDILTLTGESGFSGAATLRCAVTGPAPLATCKVSPSSVMLGSSAVTSTLTITAPATLAALAFPQDEGSHYTIYAGILPLPALSLVVMGLFSHKSKNRRRGFLLVGGSAIVLFAMLAGCGGGGSTPAPTQNYTVTVTATSGSLQHSTTVSLTVQ